MSLSELSIRRPVFAWVLMAACIVFGTFAFLRMGVGNLPDVDFPIVNIELRLPGAAPQVMEGEVVDPIEEAVMKVPGIKSVNSSSALGAAHVTAEFTLDKNITSAVQEIQAALAQKMRDLPKELEPPNVTKVNPESFPILFLMVSADKMPLPELMEFVRDRIKPELLKIGGVGEIQLMGYADPLMRARVSQDKLKAWSMTVNDVTNTLRNEHSELPAGRLKQPNLERDVRLLGEVVTPAQFGELPMLWRGTSPNYQPVPLSKLAEITEDTDEIRLKVRAQQKPAIAVGVMKQPGYNSTKVADAVRAGLGPLQKELPPGVGVQITIDTTSFIRESVGELLFTLVLSAVLTALICWLFLGSWQATLNVILAIPTSVLGAFVALAWLGFTLNAFTLLGLSLAIGIIVDDAIMVLENIVRHRELGASREQAALVGTREVTFAAIAATVAIAAIFLPIAMVKGIIGKYLYQFGITLTVAVGVSLVEALTLAPMRCAQMLEVGPRRTRLGRLVEASFEWGARAYGRLLAVAIDHRALTLATAGVFFLASLAVLPRLRKELSPPQDQSFFSVTVFGPMGASLAYTEAKMRELEDIIKTRPEVDHFETFSGGYPNGESNQGAVFVTLKPKAERPVDAGKHRVLSQQEYMGVYRELLSGVKDVHLMFQDLSQGGFGGGGKGFPVEFSIQGPDHAALGDLSKKVTDSMVASKLMTDVHSDYRLGLPEVRVTPDRKAAVDHGVSTHAITETVSALLGGVEAGKYSRNGHRWKIRVSAEPKESERIESILKFGVRNNRDQIVPLGEVVKVSEAPSVQTIMRHNRERAVGITANLAPGVSQADALSQVRKIAGSILPQGYYLAMTGNAEAMAESFQSLIAALVLGVLISYMVLASQFNSFLDPFTVLLALPFSLSGAFLALWLGNQSLNIFSMIGIVLLMGIVKKNSILLVDFANQLREQGRSPRAAILEACPLRFRPILMTSVATVVGAIPSVLALGPGSEVRIPMGLAVVGGVIVSTGLSLLVVPCVYSLLAERRLPTFSWLRWPAFRKPMATSSVG